MSSSCWEAFGVAIILQLVWRKPSKPGQHGCRFPCSKFPVPSGLTYHKCRYSHTAVELWGLRSQTAKCKDCRIRTVPVRLFWMGICVSVPPPQTNSNLDKLHIATGQDKKWACGRRACGTHNSMSERIRNVLFREKKPNNNIRGILAFRSYTCISLPLPVLQGYASFFLSLGCKKSFPNSMVQQGCQCLW